VTSTALYPQEISEGIREASRLTGEKERKQGKKKNRICREYYWSIRLAFVSAVVTFENQGF
jgi:hypothetical protein